MFHSAELIRIGSAHLRASPDSDPIQNLDSAHQKFHQALLFLQNDPSASPKQFSQLCQKLTETCLGLSMQARTKADRKEFADRAREYGQAALDNVLKCQDPCKLAQVQFLLVRVSAWKMYVQARMKGIDPRSEPGRENIEILMEERLRELRQFPELSTSMEGYEEKARQFLGYLNDAR